MLMALFEIASYLISVIRMLVIVAFIMSLLLTFNVVSLHNDIVASIWRAVNALLEPFIAPIRRHMPDTGMIDLSPMVLIILLTIVQIVIDNVSYAYLP